MKVAIVGASGVVGKQMITCIEERLPQLELKVLASKNSKGQKLSYQGKDLIIEELNHHSFDDVDYVLGATDEEVTKTWIDDALKAKAIVIDNSSAFRLDKNVPLIIPEVNKNDIKEHHGIISNPNCATIIALVALNPIHELFKIKRLIVSTYQAVSGAGIKGLNDLKHQLKDPSIPSTAFPYQIANNLIPEIGSFDENGISKEEWKMQNEARKIWHLDHLLVNCTCVRVPIMQSHSESITIECEKEIDIDLVKSKIKNSPGLKLVDDPTNHLYPMPLSTTDKDIIEVGRIRLDLSDPSKHSMMLFCCGDQIRKGAATNAIQILEELIKA